MQVPIDNNNRTPSLPDQSKAIEGLVDRAIDKLADRADQAAARWGTSVGHGIADRIQVPVIVGASAASFLVGVLLVSAIVVAYIVGRK